MFCEISKKYKTKKLKIKSSSDLKRLFFKKNPVKKIKSL